MGTSTTSADPVEEELASTEGADASTQLTDDEAVTGAGPDGQAEMPEPEAVAEDPQLTADEVPGEAEARWVVDGIYIGEHDQSLLNIFGAIGDHLGCEVLILTHGRGSGPLESISDVVYQQFRRLARDLKGKQLLLVLDSPGGRADAAYRIARLLQRTGATFSVAVPGWAKSAATLLSLGAERVVMGSCAEFGPLDVQLFTHEREEWGSALDEVQSLDRITEAAITQADQAMLFLMTRTGKKMETLLPYALEFAAKLQAPMVDKIDTIHYTQQSRMLKVAEDYAVRLMAPVAGAERAKEVANRLVNAYPEHGFVIDKEEASRMLPIVNDEAVERMLDEASDILLAGTHLIVGRLKKERDDDTHD